MDMNVSLWTSPAFRYVDGLGYDMYGEERLVIEASSNQHKERLQHMLYDTAKQLLSSICMLQGIANTYSNANFITMRKTSFDENGKYMYEEIRSVKIPTTYDEQTRLIRVMDLLAYLLIEINEQEQTVNTLRDEHDGKVEVDEKYLVKTVLYNE
ncbi:hypothetical protein G6F57_014744 [Rhizopus arrhizus]|nr:hypothetical protein G6F23_012459 [Rhizopus arrhizus]KAG0804789.1 hypothetical protein G6F20_012421 [Rhizopus arrhizus]KAG0900938.1 hypothetical protein G6F33_013059 [Rhizopus arrhizus]KAG0927101.1 hypothetical protein G6F32_012984 [Rhizopus arrhizus]KAG1061019.1 hypothetical protein G6F41_012490 [Rhizopus arrhizus]